MGVCTSVPECLCVCIVHCGDDFSQPFNSRHQSTSLCSASSVFSLAPFLFINTSDICPRHLSLIVLSVLSGALVANAFPSPFSYAGNSPETADQAEISLRPSQGVRSPLCVSQPEVSGSRGTMNME